MVKRTAAQDGGAATWQGPGVPCPCHTRTLVKPPASSVTAAPRPTACCPAALEVSSLERGLTGSSRGVSGAGGSLLEAPGRIRCPPSPALRRGVPRLWSRPRDHHRPPHSALTLPPPASTDGDICNDLGIPAGSPSLSLQVQEPGGGCSFGGPSLPTTPARRGHPQSVRGSQRPYAAGEPSRPTEDGTQAPRTFLPKAIG